MRRASLILVGFLATTTGCETPADDTPPFMPTTTGQTSSTAEDDDTTVDEDDGPGTTEDGSTTGGSTEVAPSSGSATADATTSTGDPSETEEPTCAPAPAPAPEWLRAYHDEVVTELAVTIGERSTPSGRDAAATYLHNEFDALGLMGQSHDYSASARNVYAQLPATTSADAPVLVVGAHFDSVSGSPGANDNATGVALVMGLARYLSDVECRSYHLLFVLFDEEEVGLVGSAAFASWLTTQPFEVEAVHTIDQMGWDADEDRTVELERADPGLFEFYEEASMMLPLGVPLAPTGTGFTDHVSFRDQGFDAVGVTEEYINGDTTPHYHLPTDTYPTVSFDYLGSTAELVHQAFAIKIDASG